MSSKNVKVYSLRNDLTKKPKKEKLNNNDPSFRVNYVLNVDAIT